MLKFKLRINFLIMLAYLIMGAACVEETATASGNDSRSSTTEKDTTSLAANNIPYQLDKATIFRLPSSLKEISGLSLDVEEQHLIAVNDEEGKLFFIETDKMEVVEKIKFGKSGDYEGVERVGDKIFVVKSNGTLIQISQLDKKEPKTKKFDTFLDSSYDVEGLSYDPTGNRLLLACKGKPGKGDELKNKRAIYSFDLEQKELMEDPVFLISQKEINEVGKQTRWWQKALNGSFSPSAIGIHPSSGNLYVLSSVGKLLVVLNSSGELIAVKKLSAKIFPQPEGICFTKDGRLFISSEGKEGKGRILAVPGN